MRALTFALCSLTAVGCQVYAPPHTEPDYAVSSRASEVPESAPPEPEPAPVLVEWQYYPEHDIYYSTTYGWCYWGGGSWVVVRERPTWIVVPPRAPHVVLRAGPRPHRHWGIHGRYRRAPRNRPRAYRRSGGRQGGGRRSGGGRRGRR